eukprot:CAMPEP_0177571756 /NCGR_PEP_ID=MMETSP0369-20130122/77610_1 /TAXON_ID=447022 ORGANISM="Scrippsiella hangoei-like, Strain SHHI-4" /NCGR_SAMPLE_ID=MMETSP0369 /ASSEMBLY_ACC=CAM_ASM_000364 /LENGTH=210 /DNA_ID=CAMNT_0019059715 /DNA_START=187 /DNA_END=816 /DNA_ORIENTATION=-
MRNQSLGESSPRLKHCWKSARCTNCKSCTNFHNADPQDFLLGDVDSGMEDNAPKKHRPSRMAFGSARVCRNADSAQGSNGRVARCFENGQVARCFETLVVVVDVNERARSRLRNQGHVCSPANPQNAITLPRSWFCSGRPHSGLEDHTEKKNSPSRMAVGSARLCRNADSAQVSDGRVARGLATLVAVGVGVNERACSRRPEGQGDEPTS